MKMFFFVDGARLELDIQPRYIDDARELPEYLNELQFSNFHPQIAVFVCANRLREFSDLQRISLICSPIFPREFPEKKMCFFGSFTFYFLHFPCILRALH